MKAISGLFLRLTPFFLLRASNTPPAFSMKV